MEKCLFAYNPQSGKGKIAKKERYILDTLSKKFDVTLLHSQYAGHIGKYILENGELYDTIVISGGDGTLNEAINSIARLNKKITLGYIPAGTVNDVAHSLNIPRNLKKALKTILDGNWFSHDIFKMNDKFGIYVCCSGLFTEASYATSQKSKKKVGKLAYGLHGVKKLFSTKSLKIKLSDDLNTIEGTFALMLIINSKNVAGFHLNKKATLDDGLVDVVLVKAKKQRVRFCEVIRVARLFLFGIPKKSSKNIQVQKLSKFKVELDDNCIVNLDGESIGQGSFDFEVIKQGINILVPKK